MRPPFTHKSSAALWGGAILVAASAVASLAAAPFLLPLLQIALIVVAIPGAICGAVAGWQRSRLGAVASVSGLAVLYVLYNLDGNSGIVAAIDMHIFGYAAPGMDYYDTWFHLFHALVIPLNFGIGILVCELVGRRRRASDPVEPPTCHVCGYNLTGNVSGRCPECGQAISSSESS
jgi:hypothetical protein